MLLRVRKGEGQGLGHLRVFAECDCHEVFHSGDRSMPPILGLLVFTWLSDSRALKVWERGRQYCQYHNANEKMTTFHMGKVPKGRRKGGPITDSSSVELPHSITQ